MVDGIFCLLFLCMPLFNWTDFIDQSTETILHSNTEFDFSIAHIQGPNDVSLVVTKGLSDKPQAAEGQHEQYKRVELYFSLPIYVDARTVEWPVHWLNRIAEIPQKNNSWFGPGDTIPAGNPPAPIEGNSVANHFILTTPFDFSEILVHPEVHFLAVLPIFEAELEFKYRNSGTALINRLRKNGFSDRVDTYRTSVCRKRILGF